MHDPSTLLTVASIISGFGVTVFTFRLQREIQMMERNTMSWIPWADRLVIASVLLSLLIVIVPLISFQPLSATVGRFAAAACSASVVLLSGYVPAILAHYRFIFGDHTKPRWNPEPAEKWIVLSAVLLAILVFSVTLLMAS